MSIRDVLKGSNAVVGLVRDLRKLSAIVRYPATVAFRKRAVNRYLASHPMRKLQIGAGPTLLPGFLSTDIEPASNSVVYLDATKPFPFDDKTFDYVFSEHMIEHIPWHKGMFMLKECFRILKPGGAIRIATPDLDVVLHLGDRNGNPLNEKYIKCFTDRFLKGVGVYNAVLVVNEYFHAWGHQILYNGDLLATAMRDAGFTEDRTVRLRGSLRTRIFGT